MQPFDVIKTNLIGNSRHSSKQIIRDIIKEGYLKLYKGSIPTFLKIFPTGAMFFYSVSKLENVIMRVRKKEKLNKLDNFFIGACARTISSVILNPIIITKTRFEFYLSDRSRLRYILYNIHQNKQYFNGVMAGILRDVPFSGLFYMFYSRGTEILMKKYNLSKRVISFPVSSVSSMLAVALTHPFDVIRTRIQLNKDVEFGAILWRGLVPRIINKTIASTLCWTLFEFMMELYDNSNKQR